MDNSHCILSLINEIYNSEEPLSLFRFPFKRTGKNSLDILLMQFYENLFLTTLEEKTQQLLDGCLTSSSNSEGLTSYINISKWILENKGMDVKFSPNEFIQIDDPKIENFTKQIVYIQKNLNNSSVYVQFQLRLLVNKLIGEIPSLFLYTKDNPLCIIGRRNIFFNYLTKAKNYLDKTFIDKKYGQMKVQIIEILGKPGLGKSRAVSNFAKFVAAMIPMNDTQEMIYTRVEDRFWNGYSGQPIVLYDDITHSINNRRSRYNAIQELISIGSGNSFIVPMAFEKDTRFSSIFCFITSNIPIITTISNPETALAMKRRLITGKTNVFADCCKLDENGIFVYNYTGDLKSTFTLNDRFLYSYIQESFDVLKENFETIIKFNNTFQNELDDFFNNLEIENTEDKELAPVEIFQSLSQFEESQCTTTEVDSTVLAVEEFIKENSSIVNEDGGMLVKIVTNIPSFGFFRSKKE